MNILIQHGMYFDETDGELRTGDIAVAGGKILNLGAVPSEFHADHILKAAGCFVTPALVNAHTHLAMSLFRNLADDMSLMDWLEHKIWPLEEKMGPSELYWASMLSMVELIRGGVTASADMYFGMDQVAQAAIDSGLRLNAAVGLTGDRRTAREKLRSFRDFFHQWEGAGEGLIRVDIGPHAPYTCDDGCFEEAAACAADLDCGIHVHLSETAGEVEETKNRFGLSPVELAARSGLFDQRCIAAHCVHVDRQDIELLNNSNVHVVHNPSSNLKLASGFARVKEMMDMGVNLAIGTDGSSSNNNLNMFEEMHLTALLAKALSGDPTALPAGQVLRMASVGGAAALGLPESGGRLRIGAPADIILVRMDGVHNSPLHDPRAAMVYSAQAADVDSVICNGRLLMERRRLPHLDEVEIRRKAQEAFEHLQ
ncbi:MAG TPA: amidohydrolase [Sediminispirochaeta sp.]|nr:amidohydrolase [Sediminispirochaeta sp.]